MSDPNNKLNPSPPTNGEARVSYNGQPDDLHNLLSIPAAEDQEDPLAVLRDDPNYAALIRDLEYIASAARELFQTGEQVPSDEVWAKIESQLPNKPNA